MAASSPRVSQGSSEGSSEWQDGAFADFLALAAGDRPDSFVNLRHQPNTGGALYGGMALCQAMEAAQRTVDDKAPHALQAQFLRSGSTEAVVRYEVERTREGRRFATRIVDAKQDGRSIVRAQISFSAELTGPTWTAPPPDVPAPEALDDAAALLARYGHSLSWLARRRLTTFPAIEARFVDAKRVLFGGPGPPGHLVWVRLPGTAGLAPPQHACAIAYLSDWWLVSTYRATPIDVPDLDRWRVTSLNHSLWLHAPARPDEWLLYQMENLWTGAGRTLSQGRLFSRDGSLVATMTQEALLAPAGTA